jgi:hypothetical protein
MNADVRKAVSHAKMPIRGLEGEMPVHVGE